MKHWLTSLFALLALMMLSLSARAAETPPVDTGEVVGQIVSDFDQVSPGQELHIALYTVLNEGWHTYWRNPGDSGEPVDIHFERLEGLSLGEIIWPLPKPVPTGPIINYGFEDAPLFPIPVIVDPDLKPGDTVRLSGAATYLVCKDICIPEYFDFDLSLPVGAAAIKDARWDSNIKRAIKAAPKASKIKASARLKSGRLIVDALLDGDIRAPYIYPLDPGTTLHSEAQNPQIGETGISVSLAPGFAIDDEGLSAPLELLLGYETKTDDGNWEAKGVYVTAVSGDALDIGPINISMAASSGANAEPSKLSFLPMLLSAFIGGIILNLMPCVFPVISLKALSFARHAHDDRAAIRRQGWLYTLGVVTSFMILTAVLIGLKAAGAQIGWGFQLQNPIIVGALALLLFAIGLNLIGAFEIGGGFAGMGQAATARSGASGAFFTGALAVIVATPCTAPFMAGAIAYALGQSAFVTFLIFAGLAIGFAAPFLALAYMPGLLAKLPKPGPWMVKFKEILAFPMFAAAIWLITVLSLQTSTRGLLVLLCAMLGLGLLIWLARQGGKGFKLAAIFVGLFVIAAPFSLRSQVSSGVISNDKAFETAAWSAEAVQAFQAAGRPVFVDFTAAWCVTCKVNEMGALSSKAVTSAMAETDTVMLIADWTNKNAKIAAELERFDRAGVPLYLYYGPDNNGVNPKVLPQFLTQTMLVSTLTGER